MITRSKNMKQGFFFFSFSKKVDGTHIRRESKKIENHKADGRIEKKEKSKHVGECWPPGMEGVQIIYTLLHLQNIYGREGGGVSYTMYLSMYVSYLKRMLYT